MGILETIYYNYPQMRDSGYAWPVFDLRVRYTKPVMFRQIITVRAENVECENLLKLNRLIYSSHAPNCRAWYFR
ncbi:MAG: hypothetical protein Q7U43_03895 [Methylococcaceae bacterium]|nr:hypothetical protein [Methylococcaceae bacterium]